jgi:hypothetical protein
MTMIASLFKASRNTAARETYPITSQEVISYVEQQPIYSVLDRLSCLFQATCTISTIDKGNITFLKEEATIALKRNGENCFSMNLETTISKIVYLQSLLIVLKKGELTEKKLLSIPQNLLDMTIQRRKGVSSQASLFNKYALSCSTQSHPIAHNVVDAYNKYWTQSNCRYTYTNQHYHSHTMKGFICSKLTVNKLASVLHSKGIQPAILNPLIPFSETLPFKQKIFIPFFFLSTLKVLMQLPKQIPPQVRDSKEIEIKEL